MFFLPDNLPLKMLVLEYLQQSNKNHYYIQVWYYWVIKWSVCKDFKQEYPYFLSVYNTINYILIYFYFSVLCS